MANDQDVRAAQMALVKQECMPWDEAARVARLALDAAARRRDQEVPEEREIVSGGI